MLEYYGGGYTCMKRRKQREIIMTCLYQYLLLDRDVDTLLEDNLKLKEKDSIAFIVTVVAEAISNYGSHIEKINDNLTEWEFDRLGYVEQAVILMATAELALEQTDRAVVVNEAIELSKQYCDPQAYILLNGVLDKL